MCVSIYIYIYISIFNLVEKQHCLIMNETYGMHYNTFTSKIIVLVMANVESFFMV